LVRAGPCRAICASLRGCPDFRICGHLALVDKAGVTKEPRASGMMAQSKVFTHKKAQLSGRA
jgi:hypothetical protein